VPHVLQRNPDSQIASLALLLLDAGLLRSEQMQRRRRSLARVCQQALDAWLRAQQAGLRIFRPKLSVSVSALDHGERTPNDLPRFGLACEWYATDAETFVVGPAITRLEAAYPGLGGTALQAIRGHGWSSIPVFLCDEQLGIASYTMWGGAESVEDYIEECGLDDEDAKDLRERALSRADIVARTPEWVLSFSGKHCLSDAALKRITKHGGDGLCRSVARVILALRRAQEPYNYLRDAQENGGEFVGFGAVLRWSADDYTGHLLEALWQLVQDGGEGFESCGYHGQSIDNVDDFVQFLASLKVTFATLRLLDQLIALLIEDASLEVAPRPGTIRS
jgi:PRTRC genetic system protein F